MKLCYALPWVLKCNIEMVNSLLDLEVHGLPSGECIKYMIIYFT
jgi:hypothetical protein